MKPRDVDELARILGDWTPPAPAPFSVKEHLAEHVIKALGLDPYAAERFYSRVTSPLFAERVSP